MWGFGARFMDFLQAWGRTCARPESRRQTANHGRRLLLATLSLSSVLSWGAVPLEVSIYGHPYPLYLEPNDSLISVLDAHAGTLSAAASDEHFRGRLVGQAGSWARLSRVDDHWRGVVSLAGELYVIDAADANEVNSGLSSTGSGLEAQAQSLLSLEATPVSDYASARCGMDHGQAGSDIFSNLSTAKQTLSETTMSPEAQKVAFSSLCTSSVNGICLLAELEVVADQQFQQDLTSAGLDPEGELLAMINIVEGYYLNDFNIAFDTLTLELLNSVVFSSTTDADTLLLDVAQKRANGVLSFERNDFSILHLLTGREFDGGTAGIAYLETLCANASATGTSQLIDSVSGAPHIPVTALVLAHEIGHNMGASHDGEGNSCGPGYVMEATLSGLASSFSSCSIASIQSQISSLADPAICVNFPVDVGITADAANPTQVDEGTIFTLSYDLQASSGFQPLFTLVVNGSVPAGEGQISAVRLNGLGCSLSSDNLSYQCNLDNPPASARLVVDAVAETVVDGAESRFGHQVSFTNTSDVVDVNTGNEELVSNIIVNETGAPAPDLQTDSQTSSSGGGGGGGALGWPLLLILACLAQCHPRRRTLLRLS